MKKYVIIGNGITGLKAAEIIRNEDKEGEIEIYTSEKYLTYSRPKLPFYLAGLINFNDLFIKNEEFYKNNKININLNSKVIKIFPNSNEILLENSKNINYDKLLIATGCKPYKIPFKGVNKRNVFTIRSIDDVENIINLMNKIKYVVIIGGGLLGIEIANAINLRGKNVTIIEYFPQLLPKQIDNDGSEILLRILEDKGLKFILNAQTEEILGNKFVSGVKLKDGNIIPADCVILSTGIRPNIELVQNTIIKSNKGIIVNEYMQTNIENIYAAGDVAEFNGKIWGILPVAFAQSKIAALNMVYGNKYTYSEITPSNTLKVSDIYLASIGIINKNQDDNIIEKKYIDKINNIYKKILIKKENNKLYLIGAILLNDDTNSIKIQNFIRNKIEISENVIDKIFEENIE